LNIHLQFVKIYIQTNEQSLGDNMKKLLLIAVALMFSGAASAVDMNSFDGMPWPNNADREVYNFSENSNSVFVVEAYFNGCPYCHQNAGNVDSLASEYSDNERVQVLDVAHRRDSQSELQSWINRHNPNHPVISDQTGL
jgi:hypothetical protein